MDPTAATPTDLAPQPEPITVRRRPSFGLPKLLNLVFRLIIHGEDLAATLPQRAVEPGFDRTARVFGSSDLDIIATCLRRGIMRATALHAMLLRREANGLGVPCPPFRTLSLSRGARAQRSAKVRAAAAARWWKQAGLGYLPTPDDIKDELRRRPVAPLLADIAFDLGLSWENAGTLWFELQQSVTLCGGSGLALLTQVLTRLGEISAGEAGHAAPGPHRTREQPKTGRWTAS